MKNDSIKQALFARQLAAMQERLGGFRLRQQQAPQTLSMVAEETLEALDTTVEELRVALEDLSQKNQQIREAQAAAEAERRRYQDLFDFAPDGYLATDLYGTIRQANQSAAVLLGRRLPFLPGKPLPLFVPEEGRSAFRSELVRLKSATEPVEYETRLLGYNREPFDAALRVSVMRDHRGQPEMLLWAIRDISARKRHERQVEAENVALEQRVVERSQQLEEEYQDKERWLIQTHAASAASEARSNLFQDLVQGVDAILWTLDAATGRYTFVSQRAEDLLGFPVAAWQTDSGFWAERLHPDDRDWATGQRARHLRDGQDHESEYRLVAADGRVVWFRESVRVLKDDAGRPRELRGLMVNISKRKKIERNLYTAKSQLSSRLDDITYLYELSLRLSGGLDLKPMLEEVLAAVTSLLGTDQGAVLLHDRERDDLVIVADTGLPPGYAGQVGRVRRGQGSCGQAMETHQPVIIEDADADPSQDGFREVRRLGGYRALFSHPLLTQRGDFLGTIVTFFREPHRPADRQIELTAMYARQAAEFIENARQHALVEEADQRKSEFLAVMAHELRTPLAAILNATRLLHQGGTNDEALRLAREVVERQTRHMARLVDDLLDATRLRHGTLELCPVPTDLAAAVARAVEDTRPALDAREHTLTVIVPPEPLTLLADPIRLEQVLVNLLQNAAKYTEPGGRITLTVERHGVEVVLRIHDTGVGIPPELLPKIFDLFMQAEPGTDRARKGLGIGLWIVRRLVELHGGQITATSEGPGRGSEFRIRLPLTSQPPQQPAVPASKRPRATPRSVGSPQAQARTSRVLVVDDDHDSAWVLARLLRGWGHAVEVAHDGPAALEVARRFRPTIVLLDLGLPGIDGFEVARRFRTLQDLAGLRIVALTGFSQETDFRTARDSGIDDLWVKPVDPETLRERLGLKPANGKGPSAGLGAGPRSAPANGA